jgi:hypothetical protein
MCAGFVNTKPSYPVEQLRMNDPIERQTSIPKIGDNFELPLYRTAIA